MQQRIEAMIAAVTTLQLPLEKFYGLLSDEQKARLNVLGNDQRLSQTTADAADSLARNAATASVSINWLRFVNAPTASERRGPFGLFFVAAFATLPLVRRRSRR